MPPADPVPGVLVEQLVWEPRPGAPLRCRSCGWHRPPVPVEEDQVVAGFLHQNLEVGHVFMFGSQVVELVIMRGKNGTALQIAG